MHLPVVIIIITIIIVNIVTVVLYSAPPRFLIGSAGSAGQREQS